MLLSTQQAVPPRLIVLSLNSQHQPSYWSGDIKQIHLKVHPMARMEKQYEGINLNVASLFRVQTKKNLHRDICCYFCVHYKHNTVL